MALHLCLLLLSAPFQVSMSRCVFDQVQARARVVRTTHPDPERTPGDVAPLRIGFWLAQDSDQLLEPEKGRLRAALERAGSTVSSLLSVARTSQPLLLGRDVDKYCKFLWKDPNMANYNRCGRANKNYMQETCLDVKIPDEHLAGIEVHPQANSTRRLVLRRPGAGVPHVDFLLYVHVGATDKCRAQPGLLAYAAHCQTDGGGRPLAGVVVICRERLSRLTTQVCTCPFETIWGNELFVLFIPQTVLHELFHVLGFSKDLFSTWTNCEGLSAGVDCSPRGKVTHTDGGGQTRIYTPSIVLALQRHLATTDPELGGPLENEDAGPGGVSSHWESRLLQGSIMLAAPGHPTVARIDPLTLAAFRDMGWYSVHTDRAQNLVWGDGEGALFGSTSTCHHNSSSFFCTGSGPGCHHLHLDKGECRTDAFLDGCRIYKAIENAGECWKKENERNSSEERLGGELFGSDSRCFFSQLTTLQNQSRSGSLVTGRCYRRKCTGPNRYRVKVLGSDWVDCPAGGSIQIRGYHGSLFCPDKRLCVDSDVTPSAEEDIFNAEELDATRSAHRHKTDLPTTIVPCLLAGLVLMVVLAMACSKSSTRRTRIHAASPQV
ncbi:ciliated left-right organizer metallopeptidase isoform X2 [Stigmatopora nigra]